MSHTNIDEAHDRIGRLEDRLYWEDPSNHFSGRATTPEEEKRLAATREELHTLRNKLHDFEGDPNVGFARFKGDW